MVLKQQPSLACFQGPLQRATSCSGLVPPSHAPSTKPQPLRGSIQLTPNACRGIATAACQRLKTWKLTSDVGQTTTHTAQPCLTHQEQPRHWEQQTSTLREPMDASSNLRKAAFILYKQAKILNTYHQDNRERCLNPGQNVFLSASQNT